jgi:hypothetical protein
MRALGSATDARRIPTAIGRVKVKQREVVRARARDAISAHSCCELVGCPERDNYEVASICE